ncbi:xanthine/uracil/vitamin C permease [uncultured Clostridium sp.]|uniref:xanthine/uracil/vitamin C permease n=1 Tax=uncultured Clostridium sp. TaxID=59620 RepID=UPI0025E81E1A|nr:xanthine/uracil/vitamin C permease [uncultured Clostridium sp.]
MNKTNIKIPFFSTGDIGGLTYTITNNIVNYLIVIATLSGVLAWPDEIVYGRVIPGMSIGLLLSGLYYAYMAYKLGKKEGRADVTALPSGISTPAMFVILYGVIMPLHYALGDPELTWSAAVAACFIGGLVEFIGGFIGPWMKKRIPRAALLGTVAGIGFIWMATQDVFDVFSDPVIGLPILLVAMVGVFGGYLFKGKFPPLVFAILGGIIYALLLGRTQIDFSGIGFYFPNPANSIQGLINGFAVVLPYLTIIIPIEIYNFIETMDNVEAANAAGDNYIFTQITGSVGFADVWTEVLPNGVEVYAVEVSQYLIDHGVMWRGVAEVKSGAIIIGTILGTITAFIIDKRLDKVAITALFAAVLALFGFIHSASLGIYLTSPFVAGYLVVAVISYILHLGRGKWFDAPENFEYV